MKKNTYIALLRGINVGGNNIIKMSDLKDCFEKMGFTSVTTYIQSGNVLFESQVSDLDSLTSQIESALSKRFNYKACVVVITKEMLQSVLYNAPVAFGKDPEKYRYDVVFLKKPLTSRKAMNELQTKEGIDFVWGGDGVIYFSRLIAKSTQSSLVKLITKPIYKSMTIRNINTTTKLLSLTNT